MTNTRATLVGLSLALLVGACARLPQLHAHDGSRVRPPHTLRQAIRRIDQLLPPEDIEAIRSGEVEASEMHHGLGAGLRSYWGLWGRSPLARWFRLRGIQHPDDMSGIILTSYVRHVRGEPIQLRKQLADARQYWKDARAVDEQERLEGPKRAERARDELMGWERIVRDVQVVEEPRLNPLWRETIAVARFEQDWRGVMVVEPGPTEQEQLAPDRPWHGGIGRMSRPISKLRSVELPGCPVIHDVLVLGGQTHWLCHGDAGWSVIHETEEGRREEGLALEAAYARFGSSNATVFVIADAQQIWAPQGQDWRLVYDPGEAWLTLTDDVPRRLGSTIYIPAPGPGFGPTVLALDLDAPDRALEDLGVEFNRRVYGRWPNGCYAVVPSRRGGLWVTAGHRFRPALYHLSEAGVEIALLAGSPNPKLEYDEQGLLELPGVSSAVEGLSIPATGLVDLGDRLYLVGETGIAQVEDGQIEPVLRFELGPDAAAQANVTDLPRGPRQLAVFESEEAFALDLPSLTIVRKLSSGEYAASRPQRATAEPIEIYVFPGSGDEADEESMPASSAAEPASDE